MISIADNKLSTLEKVASCSTSAARLGGVGVLLLSVFETNSIFGNCRMNTNGLIKQLLGHATLDGNGNTLGHLTGIGSQNVETNNSFTVGFIYNNLNVASSLALMSLLIIIPFKRFELCVVCGDIL